jgi:hypothetical protein
MEFQKDIPRRIIVNVLQKVIVIILHLIKFKASAIFKGGRDRERKTPGQRWRIIPTPSQTRAFKGA